jgi:hypothetical protein
VTDSFLSPIGMGPLPGARGSGIAFVASRSRANRYQGDFE